MDELELGQASPVQLTPEGHARLKSELEYLTKVKRDEIAQRIRDSKDHGEFSEDNNELDEVKQEQAIVENRIGELKTIFSNAELLDESTIPTDHVGLGSRVTVKDDERGIEFTLRMVASIEANPDEDQISEESPLGAALMGAKPGESITYEAPVGPITYQISKISR